MKFSSKFALVAAASLLSVSANAADPAGVYTSLEASALIAYIETDMGISSGSDGSAHIHQIGTANTALIQQELANYAYIAQESSAAVEASIIQNTGAGNVAIIHQK
jgi:hypothetical protein